MQLKENMEYSAEGVALSCPQRIPRARLQVARTSPGLRTVALVTPDVPRAARLALRSAFTRVRAERVTR